MKGNKNKQGKIKQLNIRRLNAQYLKDNAKAAIGKSKKDNGSLEFDVKFVEEMKRKYEDPKDNSHLLPGTYIPPEDEE